MDLPVNLFTWLGAAFPVVLLLVLLVFMRWPTTEAAAMSALTSILIALVIFKAPITLIAGEIAKGVWNSLSIIAVTFAAIMIYEVSQEVNGFASIQQNLTRLIPDKLLQILSLGWCFTSFLQGPSGFGVPIAVVAPLLIGIGVKPLWAVVVPLIAHAWANTFGTLALAWESMVQQTELEGAAYWAAAWWTGILTGLLCILSGFIICWFYGGIKGVRKGWPAVVILGAVQSLGQLILTQVTPTLSVVIPTTGALAISFLVARMPRYSRIKTLPSSPMLNKKVNVVEINAFLTLHEALLPYYALVAVSVFVLLTPSLNSFLAGWKIGLSFPKTVSGYGFINNAHEMYSPVACLTHSAFFLLIAAITASVYFRKKGYLNIVAFKRVLTNTLQKSIPASVSVAFLLAMSKVMSGSGQVEVLAQGTARFTGVFYAFLSPMVGVLGAFMSSSNVSSNILFSQFQQSMARITGASEVLILAGQTSGGAIGTMFSPSKVLLGTTTTAGIAGQEGAIIRKLIGVAMLASIMMGIVVFLFI
jgi:lactate permease